MISTAKTRTLLAAGCLAAAILAGPALAETRSTVHDISKATFVSNCDNMGGEVIDAGGNEAGCDLPSGTSVVCTFEPGDSPHGVCEVATRVARTDLRQLLGEEGQRFSLGQVPESLTSSGSETSLGAVGGYSSTGGKGAYAGGAGGGSSTLGDGGPAIK